METPRFKGFLFDSSSESAFAFGFLSSGSDSFGTSSLFVFDESWQNGRWRLPQVPGVQAPFRRCYGSGGGRRRCGLCDLLCRFLSFALNPSGFVIESFW